MYWHSVVYYVMRRLLIRRNECTINFLVILAHSRTQTFDYQISYIKIFSYRNKLLWKLTISSGIPYMRVSLKKNITYYILSIFPFTPLGTQNLHFSQLFSFRTLNWRQTGQKWMNKTMLKVYRESVFIYTFKMAWKNNNPNKKLLQK